MSRLAALLAEVCGDDWLRDFTRNWSTASRAAYAQLSQALKASHAGDPGQALAFSLSAESRFRAAADPAGKLRAELEEVYSYQRLVESNRCLNAAASVRTHIDGHRYVWAKIQLLMEQSICGTMQGDLSSTARDLDEAIRLAASSGYHVLELRAIGMRAALYNTSGDPSAAWAENFQGLRLYWTGAYPAERAYQFYADLAFAAQRQNRWFLAQGLQREAVAAILQTTNRSVQAMALQRLGTLAVATGDTRDAELIFRRAAQMFSHLPQDEATRNFTLNGEVNLAAIQAARGNVGPALLRLQQLSNEVPHIADFVIVQRFHQTLGMLRLQTGDNAGAERVLLQALPIGNQGFEAAKTERARVAWEAETAKTYRGLAEVLLRRGETGAALALWRRYRSGSSLPPGGSLADPHSVAASMTQADSYQTSPGQTIVTFAELSNAFALWVSDERGVVSQIVRAEPLGLRRLVQRLVEECSDRESPPSAWQRDSSDLYKLLIEPIARRLAGRSTIIIEPDGVLSDVPFQVLRDPRGRLLSEAHMIVYNTGFAPAASSGSDLRVSSATRALVVGAPTIPEEMQSEFPPLPDALHEAEDVGTYFPQKSLLVGEKATMPAVLAALPTAEIFHFAGHTTFSGAEAGLLLAGNKPSILDAAQLDGVRMMNGKIVVLSACSTAAEEHGYASQQGLVRAFIRAGARQVVATRWAIDSTGSAAFMKSFYKTLVQAGSAAAALQQAASKIRSSGDTTHPYYWAAFSLYTNY